MFTFIAQRLRNPARHYTAGLPHSHATPSARFEDDAQRRRAEYERKIAQMQQDRIAKTKHAAILAEDAALARQGLKRVELTDSDDYDPMFIGHAIVDPAKNEIVEIHADNVESWVIARALAAHRSMLFGRDPWNLSKKIPSEIRIAYGEELAHDLESERESFGDRIHPDEDELLSQHERLAQRLARGG